MQNPLTKNPFYRSSRRHLRRIERFELYKEIISCEPDKIAAALAILTADAGHIQAAQHYFYPLLRCMDSNMPQGLQGLRDLPKIKKTCWEAQDAIPSFYFVFLGFCLGLGLEKEIEKWLKVFDAKKHLPANILNHQFAPNLFILGIAYMTQLKNWDAPVKYAQSESGYTHINFSSYNADKTVPKFLPSPLYSAYLPPMLSADIETLSIKAPLDLAYIDPTKLTSLQSLYFEGLKLTLPILNFLNGLPNLQRFSLRKCTNIEILAGLKMPSLKSLDIHECHILNAILPHFAGLPNLEKLTINGRINEYPTALDTLAALPKLKALTISSWAYNSEPKHRIQNLSFLQFLPNLELLELQAQNLQNLDEFITAPCQKTLKKLSIWGSNVLQINGLSYLEVLDDLNLGHNEIQDVSPLSSLKSLRFCSLNQNKITDISSLAALKNLVRINVADNKLNVCPPAALVRLTYYTGGDKSYLTSPQPTHYEKIWGLLQTKEASNIVLAEQLTEGLGWAGLDWRALKELSRVQNM